MAGEGGKKALLYRRGEYLAVMNEEGNFFLCQALQHVFAASNRFKIQWLTLMTGSDDTYVSDYLDYTEPACIITHVRLNKVARETYRLQAKQKAKIELELNRALDAAAGEGDEEEDEEEEDDEEEEQDAEEDSSEEEPAAKRRRTSSAGRGKAKKAAPKPRAKPRPRATARAKAKPMAPAKKKVVSIKAKKSAPKGRKAGEERGKKSKQAAPPKKRKLTEEEKQNPNLLLVANPKVKVWQKEPLTHSNEKMPFISSSSHSKLVFRAVCLNDAKMLQTLVDNVKHVHSVAYQYSVANSQDPVHQAIKLENIKAIQMLMKEIYKRDPKKAERCAAPRSMLNTINTGTYNYRSLGVPNIRKLSMSRGSQEGNNALTKDLDHGARRLGINKYIQHALQCGVAKNTLDVILAASGYAAQRSCIFQEVLHAIINGHRKLAGQILEEYDKSGSSTFNSLAKDVLLFTNQDLKPFRPASVSKKSWDNQNVTPLHCAAINPNPKYLAKLLSVLPEENLMDKLNRRPIHYAAACEGTGPLELLLKRGVSAAEVDLQGFTPLMVACRTGRVHNVDLLLKRAEEAKEQDAGDTDEDADDEDKDTGPSDVENKYGVGGVDRPVQRPNAYHSLCPIHIAIQNGHLNVLQCLIKHGADVHKELSAGKNKNTPLMVAAYSGDLDMVKLLIKNKARVEQKDKLRRTALVHAVMNGHAVVASYLLSLGADPNQADSSGNTPSHYAAAYGWYFCLKVLLDAGANPATSNNWKVAPLGIAFLKGHLGIVDFLLQQPSIDINFKDDQGMTLVALACSSLLTASLPDEVRYLVEKKGADCTITDVMGNNPLHHLARNDIKTAGSRWNPKVSQDAIAQSLQIANLLIRHGCDPAAKNNDGVNPVMLAIEQANTELVRLLMEGGGTVSTATNQEGKNALHLMAEHCMENNLAPLIDILHKSLQKGGSTSSDNNILVTLAGRVDHEGYTPLLRACQVYSKWTGGKEEDNEDDEESKDEDNEGDESCDDDDDDSSNSESDTRRKKKEKQEKGNKSGETKVDQTWRNGQNFLRALLVTCKANPNSVVQKKTLKGEPVPEKARHMYAVPSEAKYSAAHFLVGVSNEEEKKTDDTADQTPALTVLLQQSSDVNKQDLTGRTPLVLCLTNTTAHLESCVKKLVSHRAEVNLPSGRKQDHGATPLILAAKLGNLEVLQELLSHGADVNRCDSRLKNTALHYAASHERGSLDVLALCKAVVEAGASVNARNGSQRSPLHLATNANSGGADVTSEVEAYLIDSGADVWCKDKRGRLPLHYAFTKIGNVNDASNIDPIELCTTLTSYMIGASIDVADNRGQTPLHCAAHRGAGVCCLHLLQKKCRINARDKTGNTPLAVAAVHGHESCAIMLLQKNADINVPTFYIETPADTDDKADDDKDSCDDEDEDEDKNSSNGDGSDAGKKVDPEDENLDSEDEGSDKKKAAYVWRPLRKPQSIIRECPLFEMCVEHDWAGVIFLMLDMLDSTTLTINNTIEAALTTRRYNLALTLMRKVKDNSQLTMVNRRSGRTLFHMLALKSKPGEQEDLQLRVAGELLRKGVSLTEKDVHGCTVLNYLALRHNAALLTFVFENAAGLNVNQKDSFGRTPLSAAFWTPMKDNLEVYSQFHKYGSKLDGLCDYPPMDQQFDYDKCQTRNFQQVEDDYMENHQGAWCSPLIRTIQQQDFDTAKRLLQDGASVNFADSQKRAPIVHAIRRNNVDLVKLILNVDYVRKAKADMEDLPFTIVRHKKETSRGQGRKRGKKRTPHLKRKQSRRVFSLGRQSSSDEEGEDDGDDSSDSDEVHVSPSKTAKKSSINLAVQDAQGWSIVHHVVGPLDHGSYDNVEMLDILVNAGAPLQLRDNAGLTPLDYALLRGTPKLAKELQTLAGIPKHQQEAPTYAAPVVTDGLIWSAPTPDYKTDADLLIKKIEAETMEVDDDTPLVKPDPNLEMADNGVVEMDIKQAIQYDIVMTKVDVKGGHWGMYNFYKMQVVRHKAKDLWVLFTRWGRIGDEGQYQRTPFSTRDDAIKEFCKIFKSKSGNSWDRLDSFEQQPKKYRIIELHTPSKKMKDITFDFRSDVPSKLPEHLQKLMKELTNPQVMFRALKEDVDPDIMPLGRIRKEALLKAYTILQKIGPLVEAVEKEGFNISNLEKYQERLEEIEILSNEVYQLVPQSGYSYARLTPISTHDMLQTFMGHITNLVELELAAKVMAGAIYRQKYVSPMDYVYRSLGCHLRLLDPEETEAQYLLKYISASQAHSSPWHRRVADFPDVEAIYEVSRPSEHDRLLACNMENHRLLFHGTKTSNLLSILNRGLLIAPPGVPITGRLYGKGLYTADMFAKSYDYCQNWDSPSKYKFMLVCQVALGKVKKVMATEDLDTVTLKTLKEFNSLFVCGESGPTNKQEVTLPSGAMLPLGSIVTRKQPKDGFCYWPSDYSEYIVYDEKQISLRFLIQLK